MLSSSFRNSPRSGGFSISEGGTGSFGHSAATVCTIVLTSGLGKAQPLQQTVSVSTSSSNSLCVFDPRRLDGGPLDSHDLVSTA